MKDRHDDLTKEGNHLTNIRNLPRHIRAQIQVPDGNYWETYEAPDNERDRVAHERQLIEEQRDHDRWSDEGGN